MADVGVRLFGKGLYPNISHNTRKELTVEYPAIINSPLRKNFLNVLMFRHNL